MLTRHSLMATAVLCVLTPALAEDSHDVAPARPFELRATAAYPLRQDIGQLMGSNLIGAAVVSASNDSVGKIANLVVNEKGAVEAAVIKEIGRAHVELQSPTIISYAVFCLKKKSTRLNSSHRPLSRMPSSA